MAARYTSGLLLISKRAPTMSIAHCQRLAYRPFIHKTPYSRNWLNFEVSRSFSTSPAGLHGCGNSFGECGCGRATPLPYDPAPALDAQGDIPFMPYDQTPLPASAPDRKGHIIVHPYSRPRPFNSWPATVESTSPLLSELSSRSKPGASLDGFGVSLSDGELSYPGVADADPSDAERFPSWDPHRNKLLRPLPGDAGEKEQFILYVYSPGKVATVGPLSLETIDDGGALADRIANALASSPMQTAHPGPQDETHIYVCAHGMRDCRCGVVGGTLIDTLRRSFYEENVRAQGRMKTTRVYAISHIGGHKWAANALIYPHGDWYGNLRPMDAGLLLRAAQAPATSRYDLSDEREKMVHWPRWRGRLGLDHEEMSKLYDIWGPALTLAADLVPARRVKKASASITKAEEPGSEPEPPVQPRAFPTFATAEGSPVTLSFRSFDGEWFDIPAKIGDNVMKVAREHTLPSIEAACGGQLECATCHAYLAQPADEAEPRGESDLEESAPDDIIPPPSEAEDDMLDYAMGREPSSRLTCQLTVTPSLMDWIEQGGRIQLPRF